jgi:hypothetical protein
MRRVRITKDRLCSEKREKSIRNQVRGYRPAEAQKQKGDAQKRNNHKSQGACGHPATVMGGRQPQR